MVAALVCAIATVGGNPATKNKNAIEMANIMFVRQNRSDSLPFVSTRATWTYTDDWTATYPDCGGVSQSPIDIITNDAIDKGFNFMRYARYLVPQKMGMTNNGHTVVLYPKYTGPLETSLRTPYIRSGALPNKYYFHSLHFHWGADSTTGSEHLINAKQFPAEMHLVHYNRRYGSLTEAVNYPDGLAIIGVMIEVSDTDNENFKAIVDNLPLIAADGDETELSGVTLAQLMPVDKTLSRFHRYAGSLTTPACNEVVTWTVLEKTVSMSEAQFAKLRALYTDNYRDPQDIGTRNVYKYN